MSDVATPAISTSVEASIEQIAPIEAPAEITTPESTLKPQEDPKLASRFAALARKEKQFLEEKRALKEQQALVERYKQLEDLKKTNPAKWLQEHNLTFEQITHSLLNSGEEAPKEPTWQDEVSALKKLLADRDAEAIKKQQEAEQQYIDEQVTIYKKSIEDLVSGEPDKYELIAANNAQELVFEVMEQYFLKTAVIDEKTGLIKKLGVVLPVSQVADHVEEELYAQSQKLLGLKKLKPKVSEPVVEAVKESIKPEAVRESNPPSTMTLTNAKITGHTPVEQPTRKFNKEEAFKRAVEFLEGKTHLSAR